MKEQNKTIYDLMREADKFEEDALSIDEIEINENGDFKNDYFDYYDDVKTSIKEDW